MENTRTVVYISATESSKELILVSNDSFDNSITKIYKQAGYLNAQIFKRISDIRENNR